MSLLRISASGIVGTEAEQVAEEKRKRDEELKNHAATYMVLERTAEKYYNHSMLAECDTETVVKTHIQLKMQRLVLARIGSGKYGIKGVHFSENTLFREDDDHHLVVASEEEKVPLFRNAAVLRQITMAFTSIVVAGCYEIDPVHTHLAGPYGKINVGTADEKQLMFDVTTARKAERVFVELSGALA